jgi:hypothetical protein
VHFTGKNAYSTYVPKRHVRTGILAEGSAFMHNVYSNMKTEITRRRLALAALGSAAALSPANAQAPEDLNEAAKEQIRKNSEALAKFDLPVSTEPAFQFKA